MHLFLEKGMRGDISYIFKRYSKSDGNNTIMYWDTNNLYGWAMKVGGVKKLIPNFRGKVKYVVDYKNL